MDINSFLRIFFNESSSSMNDPFFNVDEDQKNERTNAQLHDDYFENFDHHMNMFQHMEDMFNRMFSSSFGMLDFPKLNEVLPDERSPRSIMMKDSEEKPCESPSCKKNLERIDLPPHENGKELIKKPNFFSYSKFTSIKTVRLPDGTIEEQRTVIDNDGNKTTTVRRTVGNTDLDIITKIDKNKVKRDSSMNENENEVEDLEQKWKKLETSDLLESPRSFSSLGSSYWNRLKKFLSPSEKYEVKSC